MLEALLQLVNKGMKEALGRYLRLVLFGLRKYGDCYWNPRQDSRERRFCEAACVCMDVGAI